MFYFITGKICCKVLFPGQTDSEVIFIMKDKMDCIRLNPEERLCPAYDAASIKLFPAPDREEMGVAVVDNFPEEHIQ